MAMVRPDVLHDLLPLVRKAGEIACASRGKATLRYKPQEDGYSASAIGSALTDVDLAIQEYIADGFAAIAPSLRLVCEEQSFLASRLSALPGDEYATLDPIDGTLAYALGGSGFCTMIGLVRHGVAVAGMVHFPVDGVTWFGGKDFGLWRAEGAGPAREMGESIRIDKEAKRVCVHYRLLNEPFLADGLRLHRNGHGLVTLDGVPLALSATAVDSNGALLVELLHGRASAYVAPAIRLHDIAALAGIIGAIPGAESLILKVSGGERGWSDRTMLPLDGGVADSRRVRAILGLSTQITRALQKTLEGVAI